MCLHSTLVDILGAQLPETAQLTTKWMQELQRPVQVLDDWDIMSGTEKAFVRTQNWKCNVQSFSSRDCMLAKLGQCIRDMPRDSIAFIRTASERYWKSNGKIQRPFSIRSKISRHGSRPLYVLRNSIQRRFYYDSFSITTGFYSTNAQQNPD